MDKAQSTEFNGSRRTEQLKEVADFIRQAHQLRYDACAMLARASERMQNLELPGHTDIETKDEFQHISRDRTGEADNITLPCASRPPFGGIANFETKFKSTQRFACGYIAIWLCVSLATCWMESPLLAMLALAWCIAKDMWPYQPVMKHIWNTDDDDLILSGRFASNALEAAGIVVAMYLEYVQKAILIWAIYWVAYVVRHHPSRAPFQQDAEIIQGPFPMRPIDAWQCEIQRSFGFDFDVVNSNMANGAGALRIVLVDLVRYVMLFEALNVRDSWLARGFAMCVFIISMYRGLPLSRPRITHEIWARLSIIDRERIFAEEIDDYQPSINELVQYQISRLTITDILKLGILLSIVLSMTSLCLCLWVPQRS